MKQIYILYNIANSYLASKEHLCFPNIAALNLMSCLWALFQLQCIHIGTNFSFRVVQFLTLILNFHVFFLLPNGCPWPAIIYQMEELVRKLLFFFFGGGCHPLWSHSWYRTNTPARVKWWCESAECSKTLELLDWRIWHEQTIFKARRAK